MNVINKSLQSYFSHNSTLRASTTLIISSSAPIETDNIPRKTDQSLQSFSNHLNDQIRKSRFYPLQFNLKAVSYGSRLTGAYPVQNDLDSTLEMMERTGVTNILAIGSGVAIDLAKACHAVFNDRELILCPLTLGGILTSTSKHSMFLSQEEEVLLPHKISDRNNVTLILDEYAVAIPSWIQSHDTNKYRNASALDAALASLVISISLCLEKEDDVEKYTEDIHNSVESSLSCITEICIQDIVTSKAKSHAMHAMVHSGSLLSFGNEKQEYIRRNVAHAVTASLLPQFFPHGNWTSIVASLLPGLLSAIHEDHDINSNQYLRTVLSRMNENVWLNKSLELAPSLATFAEGSPDVEELIAKVEDNAAFLNTRDLDSYFLGRVLTTSLNR